MTLGIIVPRNTDMPPPPILADSTGMARVIPPEEQFLRHLLESAFQAQAGQENLLSADVPFEQWRLTKCLRSEDSEEELAMNGSGYIEQHALEPLEAP